MDIEYEITGVVTVPVGSDYSPKDVYISTMVQYAGPDGAVVTVDAWENQIISVVKTVVSEGG